MMDFKHAMWVGIGTIKMGAIKLGEGWGGTEMEFEYEVMNTLFLHKIQLILSTQTHVCDNKWFCLFCFICNTK
jgi:hypothetical protein